jgi:hypothetical protein
MAYAPVASVHHIPQQQHDEHITLRDLNYHFPYGQCAGRESNPHALGTHAPEACASAYSATSARLADQIPS